MAWKVVARTDVFGVYKSPFIVGKMRLSYQVGCLTMAKYGGIFCFDDRDHAFAYGRNNDLAILKVERGRRMTIPDFVLQPYMGLGNLNLRKGDIVATWANDIHPEYRNPFSNVVIIGGKYYMAAPVDVEGIVVTDSVIPTDIVRS